MAIFGQKGQKRGKYRGNPVFRGFGPFWALLGPGRQGFYINPSRRGPAVPAGVPGYPPGGEPHRGGGRIPLLLGGGLPQALAEADADQLKSY